MKKKIAKFLFGIARRLYPSIIIENSEEPRPIGLCVHISKKDVRDFRKKHQEVKSHREGMKVLVEESKWRIAGAIARGLMEKDAITFETRKTLYTADVIGIAYVYGGNGDERANTGQG